MNFLQGFSAAANGGKSSLTAGGQLDMAADDNAEVIARQKQQFGLINQIYNAPMQIPGQVSLLPEQFGLNGGRGAPGPFEIIGDKNYVSVEYLLQNKIKTIQMCEDLMRQQKRPAVHQQMGSLHGTELLFPAHGAPQIPTAQNYGLNAMDDTPSFEIPKRTRKENAFRWTPDRHLRFATICMALGVKDCKPKHIMTFYDGMGIDRAVISSHLQKLRNNIIKQYGLATLDQVTNDMIPKDLDSDRKLVQICRQWAEPGFTGFTSQQITQLVEGL